MSGNALRSDTPGMGCDLPASLRVDARLDLALEADAGKTRIVRRHEEGAFRLRFPKTHGATPEICLVNIAGGLAGGDRLRFQLDLGPAAGARISSVAAERVYRSAGSMTRIENNLTLGDHSCALWLPQETILHSGARLARRFSIDLAPTARLLSGEMLYFGRRASGEGFAAGHVRESWRIRRAGRLIFADELRVSDACSADLLHPVALFQHVAVANLIYAAEDASAALDTIRSMLPAHADLEAGAGDLGGAVLIRVAARDAARLRHLVLDMASILASRMSLPLPRALN